MSGGRGIRGIRPLTKAMQVTGVSGGGPRQEGVPWEQNMKDVEHVFGIWLELARDQEILSLLELVQRELKRRGYSVRCEVQPPKRDTPEAPPS